MRGAAFLLLAASLTCTQAAAQGHPGRDPVVEKTLQRVFPSVVKVYGAGGFVGIPAYGTGVIVHERGFVLTAWSIALKTDELKVVTHDGRRFEAQLWHADSGRGVAVLKVRALDVAFRALRLGDSSGIAAGDAVLAIGNPFGIIYGDELPAVCSAGS